MEQGWGLGGNRGMVSGSEQAPAVEAVEGMTSTNGAFCLNPLTVLYHFVALTP